MAVGARKRKSRDVDNAAAIEDNEDGIGSEAVSPITAPPKRSKNGGPPTPRIPVNQIQRYKKKGMIPAVVPASLMPLQKNIPVCFSQPWHPNPYHDQP